MLDQIREDRIDLSGWVIWYPTAEQIRDDYDREHQIVRGPAAAITQYVMAHPEHKDNLRWAIFNGTSLGLSLATVDAYLDGRLVDYDQPAPAGLVVAVTERQATYWRSFCRVLALEYLGRDLADEALATFTRVIRALAEDLSTTHITALIRARDIVSAWGLALPA